MNYKGQISDTNMVIEEIADENNKEERFDEAPPKKKEKTCFWGLIKKRTLLVIWGTITITAMNFGYFSGGYYAFTYIQTQHNGM